MKWYLLFGLLGLLAVAFVALLVFIKLTVGRRDGWRRSEEQRYGSGARRALFLYQPSNRGHNVAQAQALAGYLAGQGYTVTVNYPSPQLTYDPREYELLIFASPVYMGDTSKALRDYLAGQSFSGKQVLLYVNGTLAESAELDALAGRIPEGNRVDAVKVKCGETGTLLAFAAEKLS